MDFLKIHPMTTLLGGDGDGLSSTVHMIDECSISMHSYMTDQDSLDIESYRKAIEAA